MKKKIWQKIEIFFDPTTRSPWGLRIEDSEFFFSIFNILEMQCCRKPKYKNFLFCNYPKIPTLQDATSQTGGSESWFGTDARFESWATGLAYNFLLRENFDLVMQQEGLIFWFSTKLHFKNIENRKKKFWILNPQSSRRSCRGVKKKFRFFVKIFFLVFLTQLSLSEGENMGHPKKSCRFMFLLQDTGPTRYQDLAWFSNRDNLGW